MVLLLSVKKIEEILSFGVHIFCVAVCVLQAKPSFTKLGICWRLVVVEYKEKSVSPGRFKGTKDGQQCRNGKQKSGQC